MVVHRNRRRFSVNDYERMIKLGILGPEDNVELIRGEIIEKMAKGTPHSACLTRLTRDFPVRFGGRALPSVQNPLVLRDSEPEPDFMLLRLRADCYESSHPVPKDVLLLIEVSDTSLVYDRDVKLPLYAENGIIEYWIADVINRRLEIYRNPQPDGTYASTQVLQPGDRIDLVAFPGEFIDVGDLF
jgi:Uma2 family endonuclease